MSIRKWMKRWGFKVKLRLGRIMTCLCSAEQLNADDRVQSSESLATRDYSASMYSSRTGEGDRRNDIGNIEEAESSLRDGICLNYEEARALLGRLEYQRGNVEAALHVFDGIDIAAITPKIKNSLPRRVDGRKRHSVSDASPPMSLHGINLLFEAIFLKARSLQDLGRFKEAAQTCKVILDTVESALPQGLPQNFGTDSKLEETIAKAVELLPELWKLAGFFNEAILSYRQALLYHWKLDTLTAAKLQKEFAIVLLYCGTDASPPNLRSQMEGSFVPKNNIEEAILLLLILLRKIALKMIEWDPSIVDHLTFALAMSGELKALASQVEQLLPGILERRERYYTLALCYFGEGDDEIALNILEKLISGRGNPDCVHALLLASKICGKNSKYAEEGTCYARRAVSNLYGGCVHLRSIAECLLGISLSGQARSSVSDSERIPRQCEALEALEKAKALVTGGDPEILFHLSLETAEQRKLDRALGYAKQLVKMDAGSNVRGWILLARILSAQKRFFEAEMIINAALDQTGNWDQRELLRTKAKIQIAQGQLTNAIETYTYLLANLHVLRKSFRIGKKILKQGIYHRSLEIDIWHDLAYVYISMSQWQDAEICLSKSSAISPHSASRWHTTGALYEAKGLRQEALEAFSNALELDPSHVPSLVSTAVILRQLHQEPSAVARSFLTDALRLDQTNHKAWFNLGLIYRADGGRSALEAAECFQAAVLLEESAPVEPFR